MLPVVAYDLAQLGPPPLVFVLAGQFNMRGSYGPNPEPGFASVIEAAYPDSPLVLLNCAVNGSSMTDWPPGGALYTGCLDQGARCRC